MCPKSFVIIFITYVYTIDIPTMGSHRDNMCFVLTQFIVIALNCTISFSLWWTMVKMGWMGGVGIKMSWMKKKSKN